MMLAPDHTRRHHARTDLDRPRNRGVIILPNGFTLASLFFGMFAIVAASRGEFDTAGLYVVFGGSMRRARWPGRARDRNRIAFRLGARLARRCDNVRPGAGDDHVLRGAQPKRLGLDLRVPLHCLRGDQARALQRGAGGPRQEIFPRPAESGRRNDARDLLLVQPDLALQPDHPRRSQLDDGTARPDAAARVPDDQQRLLSRRSNGRIQKDQRDTGHAGRDRDVHRRAVPAEGVLLPRPHLLRAVWPGEDGDLRAAGQASGG